MHRFLIILLIASLTLTACGVSSPSLWGTMMTPTPFFLIPPTLQADMGPAPVNQTSSPAPNFNDATKPPFETATPTVKPLSTPTPTATFNPTPILYYAQNGDSLPAIAKRFNVTPQDITSTETLPATALINPGALLFIPDHINEQKTPNIQIMPDTDVIFSRTAIDFDVKDYVKKAGGHLSSFREYVGSTAELINGDNAIIRLSQDNSINPRLLLGLLEYEGRWVRGEPLDLLHTDYPMGFEDFRYKSMTMQMTWAVNQLSLGYYGWRAGTLTQLTFRDGTTLRLDPRLNAGTVAVQYLFSQLHSQSQWAQIINPDSGFPKMYADMFGDPWARADISDPIFPPGLSQPALVLPFDPNIQWNLVQGPHGAWQHLGALAAIDLAPSTDHGGCDPTPTWVTAAAPGLVIRSGNGIVMVDMDGDNYEQTGWDLLYMHIAAEDRVKVGTWLAVNDRIGHASCEGGQSYGTHLHFARKYNGEWVPADGSIPFVLSGWIVSGEAISHEGFMQGSMTKGNVTVIADEVGQKKSNIIRDKNE